MCQVKDVVYAELSWHLNRGGRGRGGHEKRARRGLKKGLMDTGKGTNMINALIWRKKEHRWTKRALRVK